MLVVRSDDGGSTWTSPSVVASEARDAFLPALALVAEHVGAEAIALVEVGASAGLLLLWDQYAYQYGDSTRWGSETALVRLHCAVRGSVPPLPSSSLAIAPRLGIDKSPIDVLVPDEALWLQALTWPDQVKRTNQLKHALALATQAPPILVQGDAIEVLPDVLGSLESGTALCILNSFTLGRAEQDRLGEVLARARAGGPRFMIHLGGNPPRVELGILAGARWDRMLLAYCGSHGEWIDWLA